MGLRGWFVVEGVRADQDGRRDGAIYRYDRGIAALAADRINCLA